MAQITNQSLLHHIGRWSIIFLAIILLFILSAIPLGFFSLGEIRPMFMLMAVYYLTILRPKFFHPFFIFIIGITLDFLLLYPLGLNAFILVAVQYLVKKQRVLLSAQSFIVIWSSFAITALIAGIIEWSVFSLFNFTLMPFSPILISSLLSGLIFPLVTLPLSAMHKYLLDDNKDLT